MCYSEGGCLKGDECTKYPHCDTVKVELILYGITKGTTDKGGAMKVTLFGYKSQARVHATTR